MNTKRTTTTRVVGFVVVWLVTFASIYVIGCNHYAHKLYRTRPEGVNKENLGTIAAQTFRRDHPILLYLTPIALAALAVSIPPIQLGYKRKQDAV